MFRKKIFTTLFVAFFISSFNFFLSYSFSNSHDNDICSSNSNKLDINCSSHCALAIAEHLNITKPNILLIYAINDENYFKFLEFSLYFDINPLSNSPPLSILI